MQAALVCRARAISAVNRCNTWPGCGQIQTRDERACIVWGSFNRIHIKPEDTGLQTCIMAMTLSTSLQKNCTRHCPVRSGLFWICTSHPQATWASRAFGGMQCVSVGIYHITQDNEVQERDSHMHHRLEESGLSGRDCTVRLVLADQIYGNKYGSGNMHP